LLVLLCGLAASVAAQTETIEYYGTDAVGSVRVVFDANGTVLGRQDYDPFGREILSAWGVPPERFGGQTTDAEIEQAYFHARQLQRRLGRFQTTDPIVGNTLNPQSWSRYKYAANSPLSFVDVTGMEARATDAQGHAIQGCTEYIRGINAHDAYCEPGMKASFMGAPAIGDAGFSGEGIAGSFGADNRGNHRRTLNLGGRTDGTSTGAVTNNGKNVIFVKQEPDNKKNEIIPLQPGQTWPYAQDGIADPCGHPGVVFKSVDGIDVTFTGGQASTSVSPDLGFGQGLESRAGQFIRGGWKGEDFLSDHGDWKALFDMSKKPPAGECK
jgi:RHS repeat-associated protein